MRFCGLVRVGCALALGLAWTASGATLLAQESPAPTCPTVTVHPDSVPGGPHGPSGDAVPPDEALRILNRDQIARAMQREYPRLIRRDGTPGGRVVLWALVEPEGRVVHVRVGESSGDTALDDAAARVAGAYRFSPPLRGGCPTAVWTSLPITFQTR